MNHWHALLVFLDLVKAFDTVSHEILLNKLCDYGIHDIALSLSNYLYDPVQRIKFSYVKVGIPQGTVLGPLLFLVYMNSITKNNNFQGNLVWYHNNFHWKNVVRCTFQNRNYTNPPITSSIKQHIAHCKLIIACVPLFKKELLSNT